MEIDKEAFVDVAWRSRALSRSSHPSRSRSVIMPVTGTGVIRSTGVLRSASLKYGEL
jgi:hypothetical protein